MTAHDPTTCGACTPETGADWTLYVTAPVLPEPMHHGDSRETCYCGADIAAGQRRVRNARQRAARRSRNEAMESLGLVRVRGALGGTYWE